MARPILAPRLPTVRGATKRSRDRATLRRASRTCSWTGCKNCSKRSNRNPLAGSKLAPGESRNDVPLHITGTRFGPGYEPEILMMPSRALTSALACLLVTLLVACSAHAQNRPPNIVFIMADDLGRGHCGCYGQTKIRTPNIDSLATQGMKFNQF